MKHRIWLVLLACSVALGINACSNLGQVTPYDLGVLLQDQGNFPAAIEHYEEALAQNSEDMRARFNLAVIYHDQQRYAAAKAQYYRLLDYHPTHARSLINLADIAAAEGDMTLAHQLLLRAIAVQPDQPYPYSFLGRFLQKQQQLVDAQAAYERSLALHADALTHYRLGTLWLQCDNPREAQKQFAKAVELDPNDHHSHYALALLALQDNDRPEAIRHLQRLTQLTPRHAEIFVLLGKLQLQQGQYVSAALHLWDAQDLRPDLPEVEELLLQVYEALRQQQQSIFQNQQRRPAASGTPRESK